MKSILLFILTIFVGIDVYCLHPYSLTVVNADIQDQKIILRITTNAEDLMYFHRLEFDSLMNLDMEQIRQAATDHANTIKTGFYILDEDNHRLPSRITASNLQSLAQAGKIGIMHLMKFPLSYTLEFTLKPETSVLQFHQILDEAGVPAVSLLSVSRNGNELARDIELSHSRPFIMARNAVSVGAPSEAGFMVSYLTLSDTRIIHEITIPMNLLNSFVNPVNKESSESIREFIAQNSTVAVNGTAIVPEVTMLVIQQDSLATEASSLVGIRIEYPLKNIPRDVSVSWENYNWQVRWFKSFIDAFGERTEHSFSRFQPTYKVKRELKIDTKSK
jgi:hypothetical protein